jgi:hypothetical protein
MPSLRNVRTDAPNKSVLRSKRNADRRIQYSLGRPTVATSRALRPTINKSAFVRSLPLTLSAADVIARARTKGIRLSAAQVYTIRANARRKGSGGKSRDRAAAIRSAVQSVRRGRGVDAREAEFIAAALDLGLTKAEALIAALKSKVFAAVS